MADEIRSTQIDETFEFSGKRERACISCRLPYATYRTETYVDGEWRKRVRPNLGVRNDVLSPGLRAPSMKLLRKRRLERRPRRAFTIDEVLEGAQADSGDEVGAQADSGDGVKFLGVVPPRVRRRTGERPFVELFPPTTIIL